MNHIHLSMDSVSITPNATWNSQLCPLSKWFRDTFIGAATGVARCGSFTGKAFILFGCLLHVNVVDTIIYVVQVA
jgi:hypothetical protein